MKYVLKCILRGAKIVTIGIAFIVITFSSFIALEYILGKATVGIILSMILFLLLSFIVGFVQVEKDKI